MSITSLKDCCAHNKRLTIKRITGSSGRKELNKMTQFELTAIIYSSTHCLFSATSTFQVWLLQCFAWWDSQVAAGTPQSHRNVRKICVDNDAVHTQVSVFQIHCCPAHQKFEVLVNRLANKASTLYFSGLETRGEKQNSRKWLEERWREREHPIFLRSLNLLISNHVQVLPHQTVLRNTDCTTEITCRVNFITSISLDKNKHVFITFDVIDVTSAHPAPPLTA